MKVSEEQRRTLFELLRDHLDEETARLVLEVTVPANTELATRGDTQELRAEMLLRFAQIDGRITEVEGTMLRQILALHDRMGGLEARISGLEARMSDVEGGAAVAHVEGRRRYRRRALPRHGRHGVRRVRAADEHLRYRLTRHVRPSGHL